MLITLSFKKSLIVEEFQGNYLKEVKKIHITFSRTTLIKSAHFGLVDVCTTDDYLF